MSDRYRLLIDRPARRALSQELPPKVAMAAWELINGSLRDEPRRIGKPLRPPFGGYWVARRSTYRIRYRIDDGTRTIVIMDVQHRANAYRT